MKTVWPIWLAAPALALVIPLTADAGNGVETAGDVLQIVLPAFSLGQTIYYRDKTGVVQLGESYALSLGVTYGLKYSVNETRPNGGAHSFPSGHASAAFTAAEYTRKRYGWEWGLPLYMTAGFVGYSRVESREHHPRDVIAGAGIGVVSSFLFTRRYAGFKAEPTVGKKSVGVAFLKSW